MSFFKTVAWILERIPSRGESLRAKRHKIQKEIDEILRRNISDRDYARISFLTKRLSEIDEALANKA